MNIAIRMLFPAMLMVIAVAASWRGPAAFAQGSYDPPVFKEPVILSSVGGVLEVTLTAHQSETWLDTASVPVRNALLFGYRLIRGKAPNGQPRATVFTRRLPCRSFPARH